MAKKEPTSYRVLVGCNYTVKGIEVRREPGDVVDDVPADVVDAWLAENVIEVAK